jgi:hypothetical protein
MVPPKLLVYISLSLLTTPVYATEHKAGYVLRKLQHGLNSMVEWSKHWNIKINEDRMQAIYFSY